MINRLLLFVFLAGLSAQSWGKLPPQGISGGAASANVLIMLDDSGSMRNTIQGATANPPLGGLVSGAQVQLAEFDESGRLWLFDGSFKVSRNGVLDLSPITPYQFRSPLAIKRQGNTMLVLYRGTSTTSILVQYSMSGSISKAVTIFGTNSATSQICAFRTGSTAYLVDAQAYYTVNLATGASGRNIFSYSSTRSPFRALGQFNGCADVGGGRFVVSAGSSGTYYFSPQVSNRLNYNNSNILTELTEDPFNVNGFLALFGNRVFSANNFGQLISPIISSTFSGATYGLAASPVNRDIVISTNQPQVYYYRNGSLLAQYLPGVTTMTLMDLAKLVITDIIRDPEFNKRANFGLLTWSDSVRMTIPISATSNNAVLSYLPNVQPIGWDTRLDIGMTAARSYIRGSSFTNNASTCSKTIIIVMSDGYWGSGAPPAAIASDLYTSNAIETHVIGIGSNTGTAANYVQLANAGRSSPTSPMFASNVPDLKDRLKQALYVALASAFTSVAPTVMPTTEIGNLVIQPTFEYMSTGQWKGYLKAYPLDANLDPGSLQWEFGDRLSKTSPTARKIWTAAPNLPSAASLANNNFISSEPSYIPALRTAILGNSGIAMSDADIKTLVEFVRGFDSYDENGNGSTTDSRWKLQDIYHSRPIFVGRPRSTIQLDANYAGAEKYYESIDPGSYARFYEANKGRREIVLAGANSGILHAVDAKTGDEVWGFIPPPLLKKLSELPSVNPSTNKKSSIGIYGIDGNLAVRDVYVEGQWRTYVAISFGQGRRGFTVIDVTNPDTPSHVVSIENLFENGNWTVNRWDKNGALTSYNSADFGRYGYRSLGYTTSSPVFAFINDLFGRYVPALIIGGGGSSSIDTTTGNSVFFVDIDGDDAGAILERTPVGPFPYANLPLNDISTDIEVIESGRSERMKGRYGIEMFIPNSNGVVQTVDFSGTTQAGVNLQNNPITLFNSEATISNDRLITSPISISTTTSRKNAGDLNLIFGTGDMDRLALYGTNPDNYIFSIQKSESEFMGGSSVLTASNLSPTAATSATCPLPSGSQGWKLPINSLSGPSKTGATIQTTSGKLASKVVQYGSSALISVYSPLTTNACSMGNSCFFERDSACGYSKNSACFANMMIGGVSTFQDKIFIGVSGNQGKEALGSGFARTDNLIVGKGNFTSSTSGSINTYGRQRKR